MLRVLLGGNVLALAAALVQSPDLQGLALAICRVRSPGRTGSSLTLGVVAGMGSALENAAPRRLNSSSSQSLPAWRPCPIFGTGLD